jgi:hypothetical protein
LRRALAIRSLPAGQTPTDLAQSQSNLAELLTLRQAFEEAENLFQQAYAQRRQLLGIAHPLTSHTRAQYAALLDLLQRPAEAALLRQEETSSQGSGENATTSNPISPDGKPLSGQQTSRDD